MNTYRNLKFRAMNPIMEYGTAIDELTGGHVNRGIQQGVNLLRTKVFGLQANPIKEY